MLNIYHSAAMVYAVYLLTKKVSSKSKHLVKSEWTLSEQWSQLWWGLAWLWQRDDASKCGGIAWHLAFLGLSSLFIQLGKSEDWSPNNLDTFWWHYGWHQMCSSSKPHTQTHHHAGMDQNGLLAAAWPLLAPRWQPEVLPALSSLEFAMKGPFTETRILLLGYSESIIWILTQGTEEGANREKRCMDPLSLPSTRVLMELLGSFAAPFITLPESDTWRGVTTFIAMAILRQPEMVFSNSGILVHLISFQYTLTFICTKLGHFSRHWQSCA